MSSNEINWHIDPESLAEHYQLAEEQPYPAGTGMLLHPRFGRAQGYREILRLTNGFFVILSDLTCHEDTMIDVGFDTALKLHFRIQGTTALTLEREERAMHHHTMGVLLQPRGNVKHEHYLAGERERSVTLICEHGFLNRYYGNYPGTLPECVLDYILSEKISAYQAQFVMRADMVVAASQLLESDFPGPLRIGYGYAKSLELLVLSLTCMTDHIEQDGREGRTIHSRDLIRLEKVRDRLEREHVKPPTISELARDSAINDAKLMNLFKQQFGQTIIDFTQNLRMDEAKRLLETTDLSITEVAFEVGYEYSSNFTTAFKRRFGITPSVARDAFRKTTTKSQSSSEPSNKLAAGPKSNLKHPLNL